MVGIVTLDPFSVYLHASLHTEELSLGHSSVSCEGICVKQDTSTIYLPVLYHTVFVLGC